MADLTAALDAALSARYKVAEVKTPATQRRGLLARMNHLEARHRRAGDKPGQAAARAAESAGVSPRTWRLWRQGARPPAPVSLRKLEGAYNRQITLPAFRRALKSKKVPAKVNVTATIRWTDSDKKKYNATKHRTVKFTSMRPVMAGVIRAWAGAGPRAAAEAFERLTSEHHRVPPEDGGPGIRFEGNDVTVTFP